MEVLLDRSGTLDGLRNNFNRLSKIGKVQSILILACSANKFAENKQKVDDLLLNLEFPVFGGIFPQIIYQRERLSQGTVVVGFHKPLTVHTITDLSDPSIDLDEQLDSHIPSLGSHRTMFIFFDGFAQRINSLVDSLFTILGMELNYLGGGAGSISDGLLDLTTRPCIFTNTGLVADAAQLVFSTARSGVGVSHGWKKIDGPFKVTQSEGNRVVGLDWEPAFQVYKKVVEAHAKKKITEDNFFSIAKCYPLGLARLSNESIVRDPFTIQGDDIIFGIPIPSESFVDILTGDIESLTNSVDTALRNAVASFAPIRLNNSTTFFFNCISRALYLGENVSAEIQAVASAGIPLLGAFTLGEIANSGGEYLEYYNKTSVVGILEN